MAEVFVFREAKEEEPQRLDLAEGGRRALDAGQPVRYTFLAVRVVIKVASELSAEGYPGGECS